MNEGSSYSGIVLGHILFVVFDFGVVLSLSEGGLAAHVRHDVDFGGARAVTN